MHLIIQRIPILLSFTPTPHDIHPGTFLFWILFTKVKQRHHLSLSLSLQFCFFLSLQLCIDLGAFAGLVAVQLCLSHVSDDIFLLHVLVLKSWATKLKGI